MLLQWFIDQYIVTLIVVFCVKNIFLHNITILPKGKVLRRHILGFWGGKVGEGGGGG